jgi:light-regulated signal transduction histidine kinase (bacteriophytochrome)
MTGQIQTSWKKNDLGIEFTTIDFKDMHDREFQYSLDDSTWYAIGNRSSLELLDLPSGRHELKLRTRKSGARWSNDLTLLAINIIPPLWEKAWFRAMASVIILVLAFAAYQIRVARLKRANIVLNRLVSERTAEIQAMNEEITSQNEQLHYLNHELEAFSYSVSHDLRAPLRSISGYVQIIEEDIGKKIDADTQRALTGIQQNASRMNNLIDNLLQFSKVNATELKKSKIDSEALVKSTLDEMVSAIPDKTQVSVNPLHPINADADLISHVWINLISNAIKYSAKKDSPRVEIGSYPEGNDIVFYVKDNGAGFDMKYVSKLFGVFQRLHRMNEFEGTGVGLALVQRIVAKHGGRVWAEGSVNEGATFFFCLPDR